MKNENENFRGEDRQIKCELSDLGWSAFFAEQLARMQQEVSPARIIGLGQNVFTALGEDGRVQLTLSGKLFHEREVTPAVGDWVLVKEQVITRILDRRNVLSRMASGARGRKNSQSTTQQVIAANLDSVWIVCGVDRDFNPRRLERYLTLVYNCGIDPVIVLTKMDLQQEPEYYIQEAESLAFGVPVFGVSAESDESIAQLDHLIAQGKTVALIGSSGAGKSTLINRLSGKAVQQTGSVSERLGKGTHTTTSRDLIQLPSGGMVIDNPGIREIALSVDGEGTGAVFPDIEEAAQHCRFRDCSHTHEKGCAVLAAVTTGHLPRERLASYHKLMSELNYIEQRETRSAARVEKERWKDIAQLQKSFKKRRY